MAGRRRLALAASFVWLLLQPVEYRVVRAQAAPEAGRFTLFKFEQAIGDEQYEIRQDGDLTVLTSKFSCTDRGTSVPLETTLQLDRALTPIHFAIKGRTARTSAIDLDVRVEKQTATIRDGAAVARASVPNPAFTMAGYAPVAAQLVLMRYWVSHGKPASIPLLPHGAARIEPRGRDAVDVNGQKISFDRYSVGGVIWGRESLWCDDAGRLVALVSVDAEFDHFEAVRPDLAAAVPQFVTR